MGLSARQALSLRRDPSLLDYRAPGFRFMFYTGVGFYDGVARIKRFPRLPLTDAAWAGIPDFRMGRPLIAGGASFALVASGRASGDKDFALGDRDLSELREVQLWVLEPDGRPASRARVSFFAPSGKASGVPPRPTGTIGTPARAATNAGPSCISSRSSRGPS